jgi:hypothetical protein
VNPYGNDYDAYNDNGNIIYTEGTFTKPKYPHYTHSRELLTIHEIFHLLPAMIIYGLENPVPKGQVNGPLEYQIDSRTERYWKNHFTRAR